MGQSGNVPFWVLGTPVCDLGHAPAGARPSSRSRQRGADRGGQQNALWRPRPVRDAFLGAAQQRLCGRGSGSGNRFYDLVGNSNLEPTAFTNSAVWFNKDAFAQPANGAFGRQERKLLRNPGYWGWDMGLRENFPVTEKQKLQFRFEVFNLLNHPNWRGANASPTSSSFGQVTGKSGERNLQLALKYIF